MRKTSILNGTSPIRSARISLGMRRPRRGGGRRRGSRLGIRLRKPRGRFCLRGRGKRARSSWRMRTISNSDLACLNLIITITNYNHVLQAQEIRFIPAPQAPVQLRPQKEPKIAHANLIRIPRQTSKVKATKLPTHRHLRPSVCLLFRRPAPVPHLLRAYGAHWQ